MILGLVAGDVGPDPGAARHHSHRTHSQQGAVLWARELGPRRLERAGASVAWAPCSPSASGLPVLADRPHQPPRLPGGHMRRTVALVAIVVSGRRSAMGSARVPHPWPSCEDGSLVPEGPPGGQAGSSSSTAPSPAAVSRWRSPWLMLGSCQSPGGGDGTSPPCPGASSPGCSPRALLGGLVVIVEVAPVAHGRPLPPRGARGERRRAAPPRRPPRARTPPHGHPRSCRLARARRPAPGGAGDRHARHGQRAPRRRARPPTGSVRRPHRRADPRRSPRGRSSGSPCSSCSAERGRRRSRRRRAGSAPGRRHRRPGRTRRTSSTSPTCPRASSACTMLGSVLVWVAVLRFHLALHEGVPRARTPEPLVAGRLMSGPAPTEVREPRRRHVHRGGRPVGGPRSGTTRSTSWTTSPTCSRRLFGYSKDKADGSMLQVHHEGRARSPTAPARSARCTCSASTSTGCGRPCSTTADGLPRPPHPPDRPRPLR